MTDTQRWHVPRGVLAAYVAEQSSEADAWSVEAHLVGCEECRTRLGLVVATSPVAAVLERSRADLAVALAATGTVRDRARPDGAVGPVHLVARSLARWPWLVAVVLAGAAAIGLSAVVGAVRPQGGSWLLMWSLAPVVPLAGVAWTFTRRSDPWAEVVLSTPVQGLGLVLWRCAGVLVLSAPLTLVATRAGAPASAGMSLTAMLGLTLASLALGTRVGLEPAAVIVAGVWGAFMVLPLLVVARPWFDALSASTLPGWGAAIVASGGLVLLRRSAFERLPGPVLTGGFQ